MLEILLSNHMEILRAGGVVATFLLTVLFTVLLRGKLPTDQGRKFAVEGGLSKGKARGAGIIFVLCYVCMTLILVRPQTEIILYLVLIVLSMLTGFFDDASEKPWNEYKKGILDFLIAAGITATYIYFNGTGIRLAFTGTEFTMPVWLFAILSVVLVWTSINVTNCTDGVDGLSATVALVTLMSFYSFMKNSAGNEGFSYSIVLFSVTLLAYLLFNATPSLILMGDAGSRAMGTLIAIAALKCRDPFLFLIFAIVLILDGGLGLLKLSLKRFLKISIMKNTRTPLHDQARKVNEWSNTQVVFRFAIIQIIISAAALMFINK